MLYRMQWSIKSDGYDKAHDRFLQGGGPLPDGSTMVGRWHAPGSVKGWLLVETDRPETLYAHAAEWGDVLSWETTPVLTAEQAGPSSVEGRALR